MSATRASTGVLRLVRTSSFRLTVLYATLFVMSVSILFGAVSWSITRAAHAEMDRAVHDETTELKNDAGSANIGPLQSTIREYASQAPGMHYLLQDAAGKVLAGNMPSMAPLSGIQVLHPPLVPLLVRGRGEALAGGYLFVGIDDVETPRLRHAVARALLESLAATVILALVVGSLASLSVLRRVETIGSAGRAIMAGDLGRRIALRGTNDEFDYLGAGLNAMLDRTQALMAGLQHVSSDIAHDLRTPLARMRQRLELAARPGTIEAELREAVSRSIGDVDAILATFSALLRIAQVQAGARRAGFVAVNLADLALRLTEAYQPVAEDAGQTLIAMSASTPAIIKGDPELLTQMLANLIENAIRHTPGNTRISVGAESTGLSHAIVVTDDGPGIPVDQRRSVLARFSRLDTSRALPGDGLGLAMVDAIATLHGAVLALDDNHPGLRVLVSFPAI